MPKYLVARSKYPSRYTMHDARREYFVSLGVILRNARLSYHFVEAQLATGAWWATHGTPGISAQVRDQVIREYLLNTKFAAIFEIATATEETVRAIVRRSKLLPAVNHRTSFWKLYTTLLEGTGQKKHAKLFDGLRLVRNTIHSNGVYSDSARRRVTRTYRGKKMIFTYGHTLDWLMEDFVPWLAGNLAEVMNAVVRDPQVRRPRTCPRRPFR